MLAYFRRFYTYISEFLLVNFFILEVLLSTISSRNESSQIIKIISVIILWVLIITDYKINNRRIQSSLLSGDFKKLIRVILIFTAVLFVSLLYSGNQAYGSFKLFNFIAGSLPLVFAFYYLLITLNTIKINIFFISVFIEAAVFTTLIIIIKPFNYDSMYSFTITRWSHVVSGYFIGSVYFLFLIMLIRSKFYLRSFFFSAGLIIAFTGVYLTGSRAAFTGIIFLTLPFILTGTFRKEFNRKKIIFFLSALISILFIFYLLQPQSRIVNTRYTNLLDISKPDLGDGSISARITGLEISKEIFKEYPLTGVGLGGYKNYKNNRLTDMINYPHNIFVEFLIELGIIGLIFFLYLLWIIFISTKKVSLYITMFFCFGLWMALFSKDIPSNNLLWLGLAFYGLDEITVQKMKTNMPGNGG